MLWSNRGKTCGVSALSGWVHRTSDKAWQGRDLGMAGDAEPAAETPQVLPLLPVECS